MILTELKPEVIFGEGNHGYNFQVRFTMFSLEVSKEGTFFLTETIIIDFMMPCSCLLILPSTKCGVTL